jgi:hypothetical protein
MLGRHKSCTYNHWGIMNNYWVVGAMLGGSDDVLDTFLKRGYWYCWGPVGPASSSAAGNSVQSQRERFLKIEAGDRIAVKKMLGQGATEIEIRALGIVKEVDPGEWRAYVTWVTDEKFSRKVPINGCTASVHGPFKNTDSWVQNVFCI